MRKNGPTWPQEPPKGPYSKVPAVSALPCLAPNLESKELFKYSKGSIQPRWGGTLAHCDASRGSAGVLTKEKREKSGVNLPKSPSKPSQNNFLVSKIVPFALLTSLLASNFDFLSILDGFQPICHGFGKPKSMVFDDISKSKTNFTTS